MSPFGKTPFLFLLIPLIIGILLQYYFQNIALSIIFSLLGGLIMLFSFRWKRAKDFSYRWLFGLAVVLLFIGIGGSRTYLKQERLSYTLPDSIALYKGYVTETPQEKPRSVAHKIYLPTENVDIVCYMAKDSLRLPLEVGDEIAFMAHLQTFRNRGNPDDFDYVGYMYNQGFVASAYLSKASWEKTGNTHTSLKISALKVRQRIMDIFTSLGFSDDEQAILSALTLGYQDTLSDDLKQGFRTTGTVHVLSVSGLHVAIFFAMIAFLLSFIPRSSMFYKARPIIIVVVLWIYAFVTGLPPSVVRASTMLTVFCIAEIVNRKNNPLNTLYIAAFLMLLYNPFWILDIGFQLSFLSVFSILILYIPMQRICATKNRVAVKIWQMFSISLVAQLATFPLCLYYFGTFPTYFFLANLIVVPLVTLIIYGAGVVLLVWFIASSLPQYAEYIYCIPVKLEQLLVSGMMYSISLLESLPFALIDNVKLSFIELLLLILIIIASLTAIMKTSIRGLILALAGVILLLTINIYGILKPEDNRLVVYNSLPSSTSFIIGGEENSLSDFILEKENPLIKLDNKNILLLNSIVKDRLLTEEKYPVDYLIVMNNRCTDFDLLERYFNISFIVLDASLSPYVKRQLTKECEKKMLPLHDVSKDGAFTIFFATFAD